MIKRFTKHLLVRYVISGGTSASVNIAVLSLLYYVFGVHYLFASMISFAVSFFVSLILQKFWTFRDSSTHAMHLQAGKYLASSLFGLGINTLLLYILVDHFHLFVYIGQFIAGGLTASITFFISRDIVFQGEKVMIDEI